MRSRILPSHTPGGRLTRSRILPSLLAIVSTACQPSSADWMDAQVDEPRIFAPGTISTDRREYGITFSPDGREAYFTRRARRGPSRILVSRYDDGAWSEPEQAAFAEERDEAPFVSADGSMVLFSSRRPMPGSWDRSENIWVAHREGDGWGDPGPLPGTVNQPGDEIDDFDVGMELGPVLFSDDVLLYWTRVSPDWSSDIYAAEADADGEWVDPRPLRLNSSGEESNPAVSADGRYLVFQGYGASDGYGDDDLYVAERTAYGWSEPRLLPRPVNSADADGHPAFSPDGRLFFFSSDRNGRYEDIYVVGTAALGLGTEAPGVDTDSPGVGTEPRGLDTDAR